MSKTLTITNIGTESFTHKRRGYKFQATVVLYRIEGYKGKAAYAGTVTLKGPGAKDYLCGSSGYVGDDIKKIIDRRWRPWHRLRLTHPVQGASLGHLDSTVGPSIQGTDSEATHTLLWSVG